MGKGTAQQFIEKARKLRDQGKLAEASRWYEKALKSREEAVVYSELGEVFYQMGKLEESIGVVNRALELQPDYPIAVWGKSLALLKQGKLVEGFALYEVRLQREDFSFLKQHTLWRGEYFSGKRLLVCAEQGLGDNLQFVRYLPMVKDRGGEVILSAKPELMRLFTTLEGVDECIEHKATEGRYDLLVPLLSLPRIFGTSLHTIPANVPYLKAPEEVSVKWEKRIASGKRKIGFVWSAKTHYLPERSMDLKTLSPLFALEDTTFYSLQKGVADSAAMLAPYQNVVDLSEELMDFADTAGAIEQMDLVISVDTSLTHLAGGMGKPVYLLLPSYSDYWRWLMDREDSPWYPTVRIFRQQEPGDWNGVIASVMDALQKGML